MIVLGKLSPNHARHAFATFGALKPLVVMVADVVPLTAQTRPATMAADRNFRGLGS